jgi:tetratricopeptide (TPR) repeat protein
MLETEAFINDYSSYIKDYPPNFIDIEHEKNVLLNTKNIISKIKNIDVEVLKNTDLLINIAYIYAMAHNLDLGTATNAKTCYELALSIDPKNVKGNYLFGMFLISTKKYFFDSEAYLLKALELGELDAMYSLGLLELKKGNKDKALIMLVTYSKNHPENDHVKKIISAINDDKISFSSSDG